MVDVMNVTVNCGGDHFSKSQFGRCCLQQMRAGPGEEGAQSSYLSERPVPNFRPDRS
jgi:hypothetical protein